ncbi:MAG TPA: hypothetical protein VNI77_09080, partial [Nitrososphaera sp.]|nr:hypothetical protein [Nitrososphaera sp.]
DGARWYNGACSGWLRLCRYVYGTELKKKKNLMERFILQVNDRTECFDDYFPCRVKSPPGVYNSKMGRNRSKVPFDGCLL